MTQVASKRITTEPSPVNFNIQKWIKNKNPGGLQFSSLEEVLYNSLEGKLQAANRASRENLKFLKELCNSESHKLEKKLYNQYDLLNVEKEILK